MAPGWRDGTAQVLARLRSSPRLAVSLLVGVVLLGLVGGVVLSLVLQRDRVGDVADEDDPEGFAEWLAASGDDQTADRYVDAEKLLRDALAEQARLVQQGDDRAIVLRGLGAVAQPWKWLGPENYGGRTRAFVVNPAAPNVLLAGGITGGVWRSVDAGASWVAMTDTFSNISVNVLEIDPSNPQVIYAGTGEIYYRPWPANRGNGIMKSTDGGTSWSFLDSTTENKAFDWIGDIEVSHSDSNRLYAATGTGVWVSDDGGRSWGSGPALSVQYQNGVGCMELAIRTDQEPDVVFASCGYQEAPEGVFRSDDGGESWDLVLPAGDEPVGFAALAIAPSNEDVMYASVSTLNQRADGLYRSTAGGVAGSWERRAAPSSTTPDWLTNCRFPPREPDGRGQGGYDNAIAVDPTNPDRLWVGGIDLFRSEDGGATLRIASDWAAEPGSASYTHADQHLIAFDPGYDGVANRTVYFANDGGVYRTRDDRVDLAGSACGSIPNITFESLNHGYGTTQFIGGAVTDDGGIVIGGTQDNGTYRLDVGSDGDWREIWGGDGGHGAVHPTGDWLVASTPLMDLVRLTGAARTDDDPTCDRVYGPTCVNISEGIADAGNPNAMDFYGPLERDPALPETLWTAGRSIWRTRDVGDTWAAVGGVEGGIGSAIGIAPRDSNVVYVGSYGGVVLRSGNALADTPAWETVAGPFPDEQVSTIAIDPTESTTVFVGFKVFEGQQLFRSVAGGPFEAVDGGLPETPVNTVAINPRNPLMVYAGTDVGVFESLDGGSTWRVANENLATTIINRLVFRAGSSDLYAFTFGRGVYRVDVGDRSPPPNDLIEQAREVVLAPGYEDAVDIRSASIAATDPELSCGSAIAPTQSRSVWYRLAPTENGPISVSTVGSNFDTVVAVHERNADGALTEVECNDDSVAASGGSSLVFQAAAGTVYYIEVTRSASSPADTLANSLRLVVERN